MSVLACGCSSLHVLPDRVEQPWRERDDTEGHHGGKVKRGGGKVYGGELLTELWGR